MTILQALDNYYHRLKGVAEPGWSREPIGFVIVLERDGTLVDVEAWIEPAGKKFRPKLEAVPKWFGRQGTASTPFFLWDNSGYALGASKKIGDKIGRDHAAFRDLHENTLTNVDDEGLVALRKFLRSWTPDQFGEPLFKSEFLDQNVAFRLKSERGFIHQRPAARTIVDRLIAPAEGAEEILCLITGERAPGARLHPKIKNVEGTASAEVPLVSFNNDAFESYNQKQGENAPTSQAAAFRYSAALNHLLTRDGPNRIRRPIGDATVVFWADASDYRAAEAAEDFFGGGIDPDHLEDEAAFKLADDLEAIRKGRPAARIINVNQDDIDQGLKYYVLGLSPNAARISVRFWETVEFAEMIKRLADHYHDLQIKPSPWQRPPSIKALLGRTVVPDAVRKGGFSKVDQYLFDNQRLLAGEIMRSMLTGTRYPRSLLAAAIIRLRAGDSAASGWHAAVIRAVLHRDHRYDTKKEDVPVSLDLANDNQAYLLGRLFAVLERAQEEALGDVNATIAGRYYGAASATPARTFGPLLRGVRNHISDAEKRGRGRWIEPRLGEIISMLKPNLPTTLGMDDQGRFAIGYYHERWRGKSKDAPEGNPSSRVVDPEVQGDQ